MRIYAGNQPAHNHACQFQPTQAKVQILFPQKTTCQKHQELSQSKARVGEIQRKSLAGQIDRTLV